jgi:hypothetical protein
MILLGKNDYKEGVMKILIVGDIHNKFGRLNSLLNQKKPDLTIACGDFGYWPNEKGCDELSKIKLQKEGSILLWCDGNHENFWELKKRTSDEIEPDIIYMPRGSTYTLPDGRVIMFMGGAHSIDKHLRKFGIDWFPEETISYNDMQDLPDIKVDIFITHTCPAELVSTMVNNARYSGKDLEPSNQALSQLWYMYKPNLWYFGHWHKFNEGVLHSQTKWTALSAPGFGDRWWLWLPKKGE